MLKWITYRFCWLVPVLVILSLVTGVPIPFLDLAVKTWLCVLVGLIILSGLKDWRYLED